MRSFSPVLLFLALSVGIVACSSVEEKPANQKAASGRPVNSVPPAAENSTASANSAALSAAENKVVSADPIGTIKKSKMEAMRREAANSPSNIDLEAELKKSTRPAAENSEFGAVLTDAVFERRTFKSHPLLLKVEKITKGEEKKIQVFLKDGRIIDIPGGKIDFISTASSASILKAAGIAAPASVGKSGSKASEQ